MDSAGAPDRSTTLVISGLHPPLLQFVNSTPAACPCPESPASYDDAEIRNLSRSRLNAGQYTLASSRIIRSRSKPPGLILRCRPALADRPPSGPGWLHEIKFDGYRVIAGKDGEQVRRARIAEQASPVSEQAQQPQTKEQP